LATTHHQVTARCYRKVKDISMRIKDRKKEIANQMPIVHAKWSGHDDDIRKQQRDSRKR
jgi:hypothetical protein